MPYPEYFVAPMREELTQLGVEELRTADAVDKAVARKGTTLCASCGHRTHQSCGAVLGQRKVGRRTTSCTGSTTSKALCRLPPQ